MNPEIYRQYDDRWGDLPYPGWGAYLSDSGCGCLAVYHCAIELEKYAGSLTVPQCRDYMVQYATVDDGTLWSGITQGLEHYGFTAHWRESDTMDDIFRELKDSCNCGVILFAKKKAASYGPDGTLWTTIGHYIAFSDYKIENGQHMFYMKDSGPRRHDGWFSYEKSMRGCCKNVWICKSTNGQKRYNPDDPHPQPEPTPRPDKYPGNYPVVKKYLEPGDRGENVIRLQQYLDWYYNGAFFKECGGADGVYGKNTLRWVNKMLTEFFGAKEADGLVGPKTIAEMKKRGGYVDPTPAPTNYTKVIDVSDAQDDIDWAKVKADGIVGVMVRCGYRGYEYGVLKEDHMFMKHIKGASAAGLKLGIYFYTQAINYKEGQEEADYAISLLNKAGVTIYYPIAIDSEYCHPEEPDDHPRANNLTKSQRTQALKGFCDQITARGYQAMIYANLSDLNSSMDISKLPFDIWCAQWDYDRCQFEGNLKMWQYTSKGSVAGVKGRVDMNKCYITTATTKPTPTPATPITKPSTPVLKGSYPGPYPEMHVTRDAAHVIGNAVNFAKMTANNNIFHYGHGSDAHHNGCYFCNTQPSSKKNSGIKQWETTYCCNPFVHSCYAHGGLVPSMLKMCQSGRSYGFKRGEGYDASNLFKKISRNSAQPGDVFCSDLHVALYIGGGKIIHAGHEDDNVPYSASWNSSIGTGEWKDNYYDPPRVYRFVGSVNADIIIYPGEVSGRIKDLQNYVDWYFDGAFFKECGAADGRYGINTIKWVKKMQTDFFGAKEADGSVGPKTIAKMKAVVK